jgi:hypothetical protein
MSRTSPVHVLLLGCLCLVVARPAIGAETARTGELVRARQAVAQAAEASKGAPRELLRLEERRLERLISDLQSGRRVDPSEIDRALERAEELSR